MPAGDQFGTLRVRQQFLEARRERLLIKHFVFLSPDQHCRKFRSFELTLEPFETFETTCGLIERNPARPGPREEARSRIGQDALINALRLISELLPIDHRQVHSATGQCIVLAKKIGAYKRRVHHAPGKYPLVAFGRWKRPGPRTHDHESSDAVCIGERKAETSPAPPTAATHGPVAN